MRSHFAGIGWLILVAFLARMPSLTLRPMISKDGVYYVQSIDGTQAKPHWNPPFFLWISRGLTRTLPVPAQTGGQIVSMFFGIACVVPLYFLGYRLGGTFGAWTSALFYAFNPVTILMDTDVSNSSCATFWTVLFVSVVWRSLNRPNSLLWTLAAFMFCYLALLSRREASVLPIIAMIAASGLFWASAFPRFRKLLIPSLHFLLIFGAMTSILVVVSLSWPRNEERIFRTLYEIRWYMSNVLYAEGPSVSGGCMQFLDGLSRAVSVPVIPFFILGVTVGLARERLSLLYVIL
jgi:4-amino-4-deoxy-L-arabinose transferase-like glycosyltransferase